MNITDNMNNKIDRLPRGHVFTYTDVLDEVNQREAVIKALNRMVASGKLMKVSRGKYYKPENTPFGQLHPSESQIVKDLLEDNGKVVGYLTGYSVFNQLGLTTQVSNTIQIGRNQMRSGLKRGKYTISFISQKNTITKENTPLLQILDAIRYVKNIPDSSVAASCKRFLAILDDLPAEEKRVLVRLALKYPPSTRALLGAILEQNNLGELAEPLYRSLNPISTYMLPGAAKVLSNAKKWNIL
jgi:hypothetical protein